MASRAMRFLLLECSKVWQTEGMEISGISGILHVIGEVERGSLSAQSSSLKDYLWFWVRWKCHQFEEVFFFYHSNMD